MKAYLKPWFRALAEGRLIESDDRLAEIVRTSSGRIQTVNLQHLHLAKVSDAARRAMEQADYVTADGWPLVKSAQRAGYRSCGRVTGKALCQALSQGLISTSYALLGSESRACQVFSKMAGSNGSKMVMCAHGRSEDWEMAGLVHELESSAPRLVLVALGAPKGEVLAAQLSNSLPNSVIIGVGGGVEMAAGMMPSAPPLFERYNLEWAYRLGGQPRRMARRYLVDGPPVARDLFAAARSL
jgi:N-acetylglucosaminyldiphosphoundecaprenol N-acetyl-beta-D-mannosaminyltransferase